MRGSAILVAVLVFGNPILVAVPMFGSAILVAVLVFGSAILVTVHGNGTILEDSRAICVGRYDFHFPN
ncbi:hypothetical protein EI534_37365 [Pseudomonas frederiksbergensis]|nr:hypothetical protein [Pseudomonas frederiksbergensis]